MSLDLEFNAEQLAIADAVAGFCRDRCDDDAVRASASRFPHELWRELAELGIFALASREADGGAVELVAAGESLGRAAFPGPLAETFCAVRLLPEHEAEALTRGELLAAVGTPPLLAWAPLAELFIEVRGERAWRARPQSSIESLESLGGEAWGRLELEREQELDSVPAALTLRDAVSAAYLAAAGERMLDDASDHACTRKQFGRAIGEFQAVAHPLADCAMSLWAARTLARAAAHACDEQDAGARRLSVAALRSAHRASLQAVHVCHQVFGALGVMSDGPIFHVSRRVRGLASRSLEDQRVDNECLLEALAL